MASLNSEEEAPCEYGEVPVTASITSSQRATLEELVDMGKKAWKQVRDSGIDPQNSEQTDKLLETIQADFADFSTSFPLVIRWMVQARSFSATALEKYLRKHASAKLDTKMQFLELQAEYLVLLYREAHVHVDESHVRKYRTALVQQLVDEDKAFTEMQKQADALLKEQELEVDQNRRQKLYEFLLSQRVRAEQAEQAEQAE